MQVTRRSSCPPLFVLFSRFSNCSSEARPDSPVPGQLCYNNTRWKFCCKWNPSGGLYTLDLSTSSEKSETALTTASLQLWHERMCHVHQAGILNMARNKVVSSMEITFNKQGSKVCEACIAGKMHRSPIPRASATCAADLLDLILTASQVTSQVPSKVVLYTFVTFN